ncbi:MAG TPA: pilin [Candidatus Dojkabacteria bacterium]|nr:pilin [Candidatus Dojkabacteria bacterium]
MNLSLIFAKIIQIPFIFLIANGDSDAFGPSFGDTVDDFINTTTTTTTQGGQPTDVITEFVNKLIVIAIPAGVLCAIILLVYAGITIMLSKGDPDKLKESKEIITNAITGFAIIMLSIVILVIINKVLGLNIQFDPNNPSS